MAWTVALAGSGETTQENAVALLDDWLPVEDVTLVFPKLTRRDTLLRGLAKWAEEENIETLTKESASNLIDQLALNRENGEDVYLVLAWDDSETSSKLLEQALETKIPVKDLTRALDDLEFDDGEATDDPPFEGPYADAEEAAKLAEAQAEYDSTHTPDGKVVEAEVVGPATLAPVALGHTPDSFRSDLEVIIRQIIREEIAEALKPPEKKDVHALVDEDGNYRLAKKGRPRKGETAVLLTPSEAKAAGLELETE